MGLVHLGQVLEQVLVGLPFLVRDGDLLLRAFQHEGFVFLRVVELDGKGVCLLVGIHLEFPLETAAGIEDESCDTTLLIFNDLSAAPPSINNKDVSNVAIIFTLEVKPLTEIQLLL